MNQAVVAIFTVSWELGRNGVTPECVSNGTAFEDKDNIVTNAVALPF
jgi:hypothetical protein